MKRNVLKASGLLIYVVLAAAAVLLPGSAFAVEVRLTDDAHTSSGAPTANLGTRPALVVQGLTARAYLKFDLSPLPASMSGNDVGKATLRLWVSTVKGAGSFDVYRVAGSWTEKTITHAAAPVLGSAEVVGVPLTSANVFTFVTVDLTLLVRDWLNGTLVNNGIALVAGTATTSTSLSTKESSTISHEPRLEISLKPRVSPSQIAILRWYEANRSAISYGVDPSPSGTAFDGANLWVSTSGNNRVTKLRVSDGNIRGTFVVGSSPEGVAFDGANIWVANSGSSNVTKLLFDGSNLGTFGVGSSPSGVAFDGTNIWVANSGSGNVTKLQASNGALLDTVPVGSGPRGIAFDGANIWVANSGSNNVTKLRASNGTNLGTFVVGSGPRGIAFDGANIWVANAGSNNVTRLRASDGANLGTFAVGTNPFGVVFDGTYVWVTNSGSNNVTKMRAVDGTTMGTFSVGAGPSGVAFDGANVWVAENTDDTVSKL